MNSITTKQFSILSDHMAVYQFMLDIYEKDWRTRLIYQSIPTGVPT